MTAPSVRPPRPLSRGDLRLLVLALLAEQPRHGYELIQLISALFVQAYTPSAGTMYPLLARMEQLGWIVAEEDHGDRRRFRITEAGLAERQARAAEVKDAQRRAHHRAREIAKAALPAPLRDALRQFKGALLHHHGRWQPGEAEQVAEHLQRAARQLMMPGSTPAAAAPGAAPNPPDCTEDPDDRS